MSFNIEIPEAPAKAYEFETTARQLGMTDKGDRIGGVDVAAVKAGPKWTEVRDAAGKLIVRDLTEKMYPVEVATETQASKAAASEYYVIRRLAGLVNDFTYGERSKKAMMEMHERINSGHLIDSFQMGALMSAQAEEVVMARFVKYLEDAADHDVDAITATRQYRERLIDQLTGSHDLTSGLSRSTSMVSNLMNDAEREAAADLYRVLDFFGRG